MTDILQILLGALVLSACTLVHVMAIVISIQILRTIGQTHWLLKRVTSRVLCLILAAVFGLLAGHTIQAWLWAATFMWLGVLPTFSDSFYFATVTYTTLGYGDITLDAGARIYATFAAVAGLMTFGISTAFLIAVFVRVLPDSLVGRQHR